MQETVEQKPTVELEALRYHRDLVEWLKKNEANVWQWFSQKDNLESSYDDLRNSILKSTYRLAPESHEAVFTACQTAAQRLGIEAPITIYQANDSVMNAALFYIPGEVHIITYGPLIEKLSNEELQGVFGHELAHYKLWEMENSDYHIAQQIIQDVAERRGMDINIYETLRLLQLNTEIYADRGAILATQSYEIAISSLVKIMSGFADIDPKSYLKQAQELDSKGNKSEGATHPETYLRSLCAQKWYDKEDDLDDWIDHKLRGQLSINNLDLIAQSQMISLTKDFLQYLFKNSVLISDAVLNQLHFLFPKWVQKNEVFNTEKISKDRIDDSVRDYFIYLIFDLAFADADQTEEMLIHGANICDGLEWNDSYKACLKRVLKYTKPKIDKIMAKTKNKASKKTKAKAPKENPETELEEANEKTAGVDK